LILEDDLYCIIEAFNPVDIIACSLEKGRKRWGKDYHVHSLENYDGKNLIGLLKNNENQYHVCLINVSSM
jgi:hypothetical protein